MKNLIIGLLLLLIGCVAKDTTILAYDTDINNNMMSVIYTVDSKYIYENTKKVKQDINGRFTSFHIGNGYLVTAAHCVKDEFNVVRTPFGFQSYPIKTYDYHFYINDKEIELIGTYSEIALLYDADIIGWPKVTFGDSDKLKIGDKIFIVGNSNLEGINVKNGIVSKFKTEIRVLGIGFDKERNENTIIVSAPVNGGDSGGPVFALMNKTPYLIGLCYSKTTMQGYNLILNSNFIQDSLLKIKPDLYK